MARAGSELELYFSVGTVRSSSRRARQRGPCGASRGSLPLPLAGVDNAVCGENVRASSRAIARSSSSRAQRTFETRWRFGLCVLRHARTLEHSNTRATERELLRL